MQHTITDFVIWSKVIFVYNITHVWNKPSLVRQIIPLINEIHRGNLNFKMLLALKVEHPSKQNLFRKERNLEIRAFVQKSMSVTHKKYVHSRTHAHIHIYMKGI